MSFVSAELRRARREIVRLNRRIALQRMPGKVVERDPQTRRVRLEIGEDPGSGRKIKSPWVRVQSTSAGAFKGFVLPSIGEQMYLESPSGAIGADSLATFGAFDDETRHPSQEPDQHVFENGSTRLAIKDGEILATIDEDTTLRITKGVIRVEVEGQGFEVTAADMQMLGVLRAKGGSRPAHFVGGMDSGGDSAVDGNANVLI